MAEVLASLKKIGGSGEQYTETSLWTNQSPTSNFAAQSVSLSESMDNFKYLKIKHNVNTTGSDELSVIISVTDIKESIYNKGSVHAQLAIDMQNSSNTLRSRAVGYVSATSIKFSDCYNCNTSGFDNSCVIPLEILGINELAYRPDDYIVQSGTYSIASTNTPVTVTVGFKPKKLTTWRIGGTTTFESFTYDDRISETTYDRLMAFSGGINGATRTIGQSQTNELVSINNDGFTVATGGVTGTWNYIAVGVKE